MTNAAEEPEIDDLIAMLNQMGGNVTRTGKREITIVGVEKLHGTEFTISPDRIEVVTFAIAAIVTGGDVFIKDAHKAAIEPFSFISYPAPVCLYLSKNGSIAAL